MKEIRFGGTAPAGSTTSTDLAAVVEPGWLFSALVYERWICFALPSLVLPITKYCLRVSGVPRSSTLVVRDEVIILVATRALAFAAADASLPRSWSTGA